VPGVAGHPVGGGGIALERKLPEQRRRGDRTGGEQEIASSNFSHP
jgi:hypothetical protein